MVSGTAPMETLKSKGSFAKPVVELTCILHDCELTLRGNKGRFH